MIREVLRGILKRLSRGDVLILTLFFCLLFGGVFLGDGKQGVIEIYSSSIVLVCWGVFRYLGLSFRRLPSLLYVAWVAYFLVALVSMVFSDSIGYSISWFVRGFSAFVIYLLFYTLASKITAKLFVYGTTALVVCTSALFIVTWLFPVVSTLLPSMNLVDVRHGHSHIVNLLVFVAPIILSFLLYRKAALYQKIIATCVYFLIMFSTYSRGAWLVVAGYFFIQSFARFDSFKKRALMVICICIVIGVGAYIKTNSGVSPNNSITIQLLRPITISSRLEYWRQARETFIERPMFGSGPGTFSLESLRYQKLTGRSSWFAHSILMQTLAEIGAFGLVALVWLIGAHFWIQYRKINHSPVGAPNIIIHGCILLCVYGVFEFVLDYQIMWFLFWGGVGVFTGIHFPASKREKGEQRLIFLSLGYLTIFYLLWALSALAYLVTPRQDIIFLLAPYDAGNALMALTKINEKQHAYAVMYAAKLFHSKNPNIVLELSKAQRKFGYRDEANYSIEIAAYTFLTFENIQKEYITVQLDNKNYINIKNWLRDVAPTLFYSDAPYKKSDVDISLDIIKKIPPQTMLSLFDSLVAPNIRYSRFFYNVGFLYLSTNPQKTAALWLLSNNLQPTLSYIWIERAALEKYVLFDEQNADMILHACEQDVVARKHCLWVLQTDQIPYVGSHTTKINEN